MTHLLTAGKHLVTVREVRRGPTHTRIGFISADGRSAVQTLSNDQLVSGLKRLGVPSAETLTGKSCIVQTEVLSPEAGVVVARVTACQWMHNSPIFGEGIQA
jgi:hypothetical protein